MKRHHFYPYVLLLLAALLMQGCLKEQEDIFDEKPTERLEDFLDRFKSVLESSEDGWVMDYYPQPDQSIGGVAYIVKFKDGEITAWWENRPGQSKTSNYSFKRNSGPMLSFDTYNEFLHYYAEGRNSSSLYQGYKGDFEFRLDSIVGNDHVYMHGNRTNNVIALHRFTGNPDEYLAEASQNAEDIIVDYLEGTYAQASIRGEVAPASRRIDFTVTDAGKVKEYSRAYLFTNQGLRLYRPVTINGKPMQDFKLATTGEGRQELQCLDEGLTDLKLSVVVPEGYCFYNEFAGTYTLLHYEIDLNEPYTTTVQLVPNPDGKTYSLTGLCKEEGKWAAQLKYLKTNGTLLWLGQSIGTTTEGWEIWIAPYTKKRTGTMTGTVYKDDTIGFELRKSSDTDKFVLNFNSYDPKGTNNVTSFRMRCYSGSTNKGNPTEDLWMKYFKQDGEEYSDYSLYYPETMTKQ